jgi:hypothetical protein
MTERTNDGERRLRFTPEHPNRRTEDKILLAIDNYIETAIDNPKTFQYEDGSPTQGIAMIRNEQGEIVAHALRMGGRTVINAVGKNTDTTILVYSDQIEPYIIGTQRFGSGEQRQRITEFSPMGQRAEYTSRLTALALRIGVLKPLGQKQPVQQIGDKQKR